MSSTNQSPEYFAVEKKYLNSETLEDKIFFLGEMLRNFKKHKGSEKMQAELKTRLKKFQEKAEKASKKSSGKKGIKKEGFQCLLIGPPNSGKTTILSKITNAKPLITQHAFNTQEPIIGTLNYEGIKAQIIDMPSIGSENLDISLVNTANLLIFVVTSLDSLPDLEHYKERSLGSSMIVLNKSDLLSSEKLRKLQATIKAKKIPGIIISAVNESLDPLKKEIISRMNIIRVYTKEPRKPKTKEPILLPQGSKVKDAAEEILKGFSKKVKQTKITGPSSKFPNQVVGLSHVLKDLDIIEFHTK